MTSKHTLFPLLILFIFSISCKKNDISNEIDKKEQAEITYKAFLEEQIAQLPEISAPTTEHLSFQKINPCLLFLKPQLS